MRTHVAVIGITVLALGLVLGGCGKAAEKTGETIAEKAIEKALSADGKKVDVKIGKDGQASNITVQGKDSDGNKIDMTMNVDGGKGTLKMNDKNMDMTMSGDGDKGSLQIKGPEGTMTMTSGDSAVLPPNYPKDIPLYPGLKLNMVQTIPENNAFVVQGFSDDPLDKVAAFCKEKFPVQGWTEQTSMNQGGDSPMAMFAFQKAQRTLTILIGKEENRTSISLSVGGQ
ncbi:MAG TPA: hypothetical protein PLI09_08215 [Candidatus Hydrogenedentes bacterium]|nr:hypothetical protein [Candidatus Hydrogenedentota bacterium]